ncbi:hypothetical protein ABZY81_40890 [Streptomyces sp. NPDC006514]|uniref:hypothetical protein n=1 Tax=Streptomyces sp. NPDC006514 TaxID=3154308 RepID=UPI0033AA672B
MEDLLKFLAARIGEDKAHAVDAIDNGGTPGSFLPLLEAVEALMDEYRGLSDPWDGRTHGFTTALRVLSEAYATHSAYREEWR